MCPNNAPVPLRPHHGMCLAYFRGQGYSDGFTRHMERTLERLTGESATVRLTVAADEVCAACPNNEGGQCVSGDKPERYDRAVLALCGLGEGAELPFSDFAGLVQRRVLSAGLRETICGDCQWSALCRGGSRWEKE